MLPTTPMTPRMPARRSRLLALIAAGAALLISTSSFAWTVVDAGAGQAGPTMAAARPRTLTADELKPRIVKKFIPFTQKRRNQMKWYSNRHYGDYTEVLSDPQVIVRHFTTSHQMMDAWWYFAGNTPARGERPGVCSHFILDTDGTIYQVMPLDIRCRHATGLNNIAIGIEDVGVSDVEILRNQKMMESSYRLTLWLMALYGIEARNVIGHSEIIFSPLHHDLVPEFRCMRHSDWSRKHMRLYRTELRERAVEAGVPIGPPVQWVDPDC